MDESSSDLSVDDELAMQGGNVQMNSVPHTLQNNIPLSYRAGADMVDGDNQRPKQILTMYPMFQTQPDFPYAKDIEEFLSYSVWVKPKPEHVNAFYNDDDTVLTHCIRLQNITAVIGLLVGGCDPNLTNRKGVTPISVAAHKGNIDIMLGLIEFGANVNSLNSSGSTALIQASHFGNIEAVRLLLQNNATADFANLKGTTALMRASQEGHVEISKLLIDSSSDVNRKNHEGMNALMLASQRGHADMVLLLIKAGAAMDEQTSQGSTALMLACKRGHEKCVEVLVTMGAEIYIRDCRNRTARDTATRRNHIDLLYWLDTQVQVNRMQEYRRRQRSYLLMEMRAAFHKNCLHLHPTEVQLVNVLESLNINSNQAATLSAASTSGGLSMPVRSRTSTSTSGLITAFARNTSLSSNSSSEPSPELRVAWKESSDDLSLSSLGRGHWPASLKKRQPYYQDWQWSKLLYKCMELPDGIFDMIVDYMPLPRIWQWSLWRLRQRCKLSPHVSILDTSKIMDEILADSNIFKSKEQSQLLVRISRDSSIHPYLTEHWDINKGLLDSLVQWSDVQSLAGRVTDAEVLFKAKLSRNMLNATISLYKWYRNKTASIKALENLIASQPNLARGELSDNAMDDTQGIDDENDILEATDIGGEEGSDGENLDHETENEMPADGDERFDDEFVDSDGDPNELSAMQIFAMPPFNFPGLD